MGDYDETLRKYTNEIRKNAAEKKIHVQSVRAGSGAASVKPDEIHKDVSSKVDHLFNPFLGMPDPVDYQPIIDHFDNAMGALSRGVSGEKVTDVLDQNNKPPANSQMDMVESAAKNLLKDWSGAAASEFENNFSRRFPAASKNHFNLMSVMKAALAAQQAMWKAARTSIDDTVKETLNAIDNVPLYCHWSSDVSFNLSVISAVVSGSAISGVTSLMTAAISVGKAADEGAKKVNGEAASVDAVLNTLTKGVQSLVDDIRNREQKIANGLVEFTKEIEKPATRADFVLPRPTLADMRGHPDEIRGPNGLGKPKEG